MRSTRKVRTASRVEVPGHEVPVPEAEPQARRSHAARRLAVGERRHGVGAHRLEEVDEGLWRHQRGDGTDVAQTGGAQLQKSIPPTRIVEVHAGDGQVEGDLLVGLERQVRQVERVAIDQVPVLLLTGQAAASAPECPRRAGAACPARRPAGAPRAPRGSRAPAGRWRRAVSGWSVLSRTSTRSVTRSSRSSRAGPAIAGEPTAAAVA